MKIVLKFDYDTVREGIKENIDEQIKELLEFEFETKAKVKIKKEKVKECKHDYELIYQSQPYMVEDGDMLCTKEYKCRKCGYKLSRPYS